MAAGRGDGDVVPQWVMAGSDGCETEEAMGSRGASGWRGIEAKLFLV